MTHYWFYHPIDFRECVRGIGVTANSLEDAYYLMEQEEAKLLLWIKIPEIHENERSLASLRMLRHVEFVGIAEVEQGHVAPNLGDFDRRGIWWPVLPTTAIKSN